MLIELKQRAISAVRGPVRGKRYDIALGNPRHFFDCHVFARHLGANRCREYLGIPRVCLCMQPGRAFLHILMLFLVGSIFAQDVLPTSTPTRKRGWLGRLLDPFSPESISQYKDTRL